MPLALLPLSRFVMAVLSISIPRARRPLLVVAHLIDAVLLTQLALTLMRGAPASLVLGGAPSGLGIPMIGDRIGITFAALAWGLSIAVSVYSWSDRLRPYFFLLLHFLVGACYALAFTKDLFNAYLLFEFVTLVGFLLVGYPRQPRQIWASLGYLVLSSFGMTLFLFGIGIIYAHCGTLDLGILRPLLVSAHGEPWALLAASLLTAGVSVKAGVFLFSLWLPAAHSRAMPVVSALLSGLVIKMGVLELFRIADIFPLRLPLLVLGSITGLVGIVYAIHSYDIKRMLAFHTLSQIGYILIGFGAGTPEARLGALAYAVAHGLFKALLFLSVGEAAEHAGCAQRDVLLENRRLIPWGARMALLIGTLGIIGLPPLAGFDAKAILEDGVSAISLRIVILLISIGTVVSFSKLVPILFVRSQSRTSRPHALGYAFLGGLILLFWPISVLMTSMPLCLDAFSVLHLVEALVALSLGGLIYLLVRKRTFRLPHAIFHLDQSPILILLGFFLVFALLLGSL